MKPVRFTVALTCVALVVLGTQAEAKTTKPKPPTPPARSCPSLTDPAGDANGINPGAPVPAEHAGPSIDPLDILSVDLGTSKKTMVWVMRVKALSASSPDAPTGMFWTVHFSIRRTTFAVTAHSDPTSGVSYDLAYATSTGGGREPGALSGTFDVAHSQLRLTVPVATIATWEPAPLSTKITGVSGTTGQELVAPGFSAYTGAQPSSNPTNAVDWTTGEVTYTPGARCTH